MPKVSVIIPVYGVEKYIERCARSLFEQTLDDIEYLFIDDCTPDKSIEILKQVLEHYPNRKPQVTIHRMEHNSGQAKVREWGILNAKGEFLIHCDSDDWVDCDIYKKMYEKASAANADVTICDYYDAYSTSSFEPIIRDVTWKSREDLLRLMLSGYSRMNLLWGALVRRYLFDNILFPNGNQGEDAVIMRQIVWYSNKIIRVPEPLYYYYRDNPESISNNREISHLIRKSQQVCENCITTETFLRKERIDDLYEQELIALKYRTRLILWNGRRDENCLDLWNKIFPEINDCKILMNRILTLKEKSIHIVVISKVYNFLRIFNV